MRLKRRNVLLGLVGLSLPLIASSCSGNSPEPTSEASFTESAAPETTAQAPETIRIGYQVIPNAELLAKALGLTEKAFPNSQVEYISFDSGRDVNTAVAADGIDFGLIGSVGVGVGIAQGLPYEVYFIHDVIGKAEALVVRQDITSVADLAGKRVGVPFGSTTHFSLLSLLELEQISPDSLTILDLQPQDLVAAWQRQDVNAGYVWQPHLSRLVEDGGTVLTTSADLAERGVLTADVGIVRQAFVDEYPDVVKQYVAVLDEAVKLYRDDPEAVAEAIAPELGLTPEESLTVMEQLIWLDSSEQAKAEYLGSADQPGAFAEVLKSSADFMVTQGAIATAPDLDTYKQRLRGDVLQ
ncbi:ABC transporter substrate-binding protein [Oculatella sp. FACHB-28]|uniref:taurine ABC transporter substrate-binding protein n=1 Tax=Oculatella sp. FACHB-28 TaxID=2692845 RepID=UPI00168295D8|nr:ABC transporter substrate-binding protein [Oculatella sp. FACHB-28]MBD2058016.1 ABC transporter substrate-binding protein [Oculatella sp. FACHB-28]